jgi:hypothetical protein
MLNVENVGSCSNTCYIKYTYSFEHIHAIYYITYINILHHVLRDKGRGTLLFMTYTFDCDLGSVSYRLTLIPCFYYVYVNVASSEDDNKTFNV